MKISFENRPAYAFLGVAGPVGGADAASLRTSARERATRHEATRVLVDVRDAELSREARDELLDFARAPDAASAAMVTSDDLFVAEINMASLAAGSRARAFTQHSDAHRWLSRGSILKTPVEIPKDHPRLSDRPVGVEERRRALLEVPHSPRVEPSRSAPRPRPTSRTERPTPVDSGQPRKRS